eukprot:11191316-Lingulodinium_polyedra.AAC.1
MRLRAKTQERARDAAACTPSRCGSKPAGGRAPGKDLEKLVDDPHRRAGAAGPRTRPSRQG